MISVLIDNFIKVEGEVAGVGPIDFVEEDGVVFKAGFYPVLEASVYDGVGVVWCGDVVGSACEIGTVSCFGLGFGV